MNNTQTMEEEYRKTLVYLSHKLIDGLDFSPVNANFVNQLGQIADLVSEGNNLDDAIAIVSNASYKNKGLDI